MKKSINPWTQLSIDYASQRSYLDDLFQVYPTIPEGIREPSGELWKDIETAFEKRPDLPICFLRFRTTSKNRIKPHFIQAPRKSG